MLVWVFLEVNIMIVLYVLKFYWGKLFVRENVEGVGGGWESY